MQCSGIHRGLGVHISQVRSTTLDTWQADQVKNMGAIGNARSNAKYEAKLPKNHKRPSHVRDGQGAVERFIRQKYVQKKWFAEEISAPAQSPAQAAAPRQERRKVEPMPSSQGQAKAAVAGAGATLLPDLLVTEAPNVMDGIGAGRHGSLPSTTAVPSTTRSFMDDLESLSLAPPPASTAARDPPKAAPAPTTTTEAPEDIWGTPFMEAPAPSADPSQSVQRRASSKEDIMSLYDSSASTSGGVPGLNPMMDMSQMRQQQQPFGAFGGMNSNPMQSMGTSYQQQHQGYQSQGYQSYQSYQSGPQNGSSNSTFYNSF